MTETTRDFTSLKLASADPSVLRDLIASLQGGFGTMNVGTAAQTKNFPNGTYSALGGYTASFTSPDVTADKTAGTLTVSIKGIYLVWFTATVLDAGESAVISLAIHKDGKEHQGARQEATMTATLEIPMSGMDVIECPAGTEVFDLRVKGSAATTGSNWIATLGLKRVG